MQNDMGETEYTEQPGAPDEPDWDRLDIEKADNGGFIVRTSSDAGLSGGKGAPPAPMVHAFPDAQAALTYLSECLGAAKTPEAPGASIGTESASAPPLAA